MDSYINLAAPSPQSPDNLLALETKSLHSSLPASPSSPEDQSQLHMLQDDPGNKSTSSLSKISSSKKENILDSIEEEKEEKDDQEAKDDGGVKVCSSTAKSPSKEVLDITEGGEKLGKTE